MGPLPESSWHASLPYTVGSFTRPSVLVISEGNRRVGRCDQRAADVLVVFPHNRQLHVHVHIATVLKGLGDHRWNMEAAFDLSVIEDVVEP